MLRSRRGRLIHPVVAQRDHSTGHLVELFHSSEWTAYTRRRYRRDTILPVSNSAPLA